MKQLKFIFTLGIIFVGICCNNVVDVEEVIVPSQLITLEDINYSPIFKNPYEEVGEYHNEGLKYVFENYCKLSVTRSNANQQEVLNELMINFFSEKKLPRGINVSRDDSKSFLKRLEIGAISRSGNVNFESIIQQEYCDKVRKVLRGGKIISSPQALVFEINKIEREVEKSKMSELEKAQVLVATAVAKHSSIFWIEQMLSSDDNSPVLIKTRSGESGSNDWLSWFERVFMPKAMKVLEADFAGAVAGIVEGFFFGGAAGSIVPGAGTVTVAITGAIANGTRGAIWGSVCEGIGIDWTFWN